MIQGHTHILRSLKEDLPAVSLFYGPASVGKWTTAEYIRKYYNYEPVDVIRIHKLTAALAGYLVKISDRTSSGHQGRLVIMKIDGASAEAFNRLLLTLEHAQNTKFILISESVLFPTIASRAVLYSFSVLTEEEVVKVLQYKMGFKEDKAQELAKLSGGQVERAVQAVSDQDNKAVVLAVLEAIQEKDVESLDRLADRWSDNSTRLLQTWCREALTGRWRVFTPDDSGITGQGLPLQILISTRPDVRPKLVVRSGLMSIVRGA